MALTMLFTVIGLMAGAANSAPSTPSEPARCCLDKQFTAALADIGAVGSGNALFFLDGTTAISYDYYQQKLRTYTLIQNPDGSFLVIDELHDYANGVVYTTDERGNCTVGPLKPYDFMFDGCIPDDATYVGPAVFGQGLYSISVHVWSFLLPGNGAERWEINMTVAQQHCVPVIETLASNLDGAPFEESLFYTGYRPGVDPQVSFAPPANCRRSG